MQARYWAVVAAALTLSTSACHKADRGAACFPEPARRWIGEAGATGVPKDDAGPLHIYVDGSASIAGFIRGESKDERPLADLVGMLPTLPGIAHNQISATRFDRQLNAISLAEFQGMERAEAYLCPAGQSDCDHNDSHID